SSNVALAPPSSSVTVIWTAYVPGCVKVWVRVPDAPECVVPSQKSHAYVATLPPSYSVAEPVKVTTSPTPGEELSAKKETKRGGGLPSARTRNGTPWIVCAG